VRDVCDRSARLGGRGLKQQAMQRGEGFPAPDRSARLGGRGLKRMAVIGSQRWLCPLRRARIETNQYSFQTL